VQPGSAAARAGLRPRDIVVAANGRDTPTATALRNAVGLTEIGQRLRLTVQRGGERLEIPVEVQP
jgi:S1-C subfamily serine protease